MHEFQEFPKMYRISRECIVTEKIDGTNAQVCIVNQDPKSVFFTPCGDSLWLAAGSRTQYITPQDDNFGFAKWAWENAESLSALGPGRHFGEWWGKGIQRTYGLQERRWSLFNTSRWLPYGTEPVEGQVVLPECCHLVPVLFSGTFSPGVPDNALAYLQQFGSQAAPGFPRPEGVVLFHVPSNTCFKKTLDGDGHKR